MLLSVARSCRQSLAHWCYLVRALHRPTRDSASRLAPWTSATRLAPRCLLWASNVCCCGRVRLPSAGGPLPVIICIGRLQSLLAMVGRSCPSLSAPSDRGVACGWLRLRVIVGINWWVKGWLRLPVAGAFCLRRRASGKRTPRRPRVVGPCSTAAPGGRMPRCACGTAACPPCRCADTFQKRRPN